MFFKELLVTQTQQALKSFLSTEIVQLQEQGARLLSEARGARTRDNRQPEIRKTHVRRKK